MSLLIEQYRVVTIFDPFDYYNGHATERLVDHSSISLTFATLNAAEDNAESMRKCHIDTKTTIKTQRIEGRVVTPWTEVTP